MNNIKVFLFHSGSIAKKELKGYIDTPTAYIVAIVFLLLTEFLFFKQAFLIGEASLRSLAVLLPWLFLLLIPAMSMGSIAEEKDKGTLEMILTKPIKEIELISGKFLANLIFVAVIMLFLFPIAWGLAKFGDLDWGIVLAQYLAGVLLGSVLMSLGIAVSSMFKSQVSSFLLSAVLSLLLLIIGFDLVTASLPHSLAIIFERLSALTHYNSMARGVIDLRDIWYIVCFIAIALSLAYLQLIKRKYSNQAKLYRSYKLGIILFITIAILTNIAGSRIPGRLDLTQGRLFTLTSTSKNILQNLDDIVTINLYASKNLPAQFQPILRDTKDMLRDYERFSHGNIKINIKNPSTNPETISEIQNYGIREVRFNVVGQEEFQVKQGYLGLAVNYAGKHESIPFIQNTGELEYQLTSFIQQLTNKNKKKIVFVTGHNEKSIYKDYSALKTELSKQFDISTLALTSSTTAIDPAVAVMVFADPTANIATSSKSLVKQAIDNGTSAMFLLDGVNINLQYGQVSPNASNIFAFVNNNFGVSVNKDLVYDLKSNETVNAGGGGFFQLFLPYPLWLKSLATKSLNPITSKVNTITLPWASSITADNNEVENKGWTKTNLFSTSKFAGIQSGKKFNIDPKQQFSQSNLSAKLVALALTPKDEESGKGRVVIISDSDLLTDQFTKQNAENMGFGMESLSWLAQENSLAGIRIKQAKDRSLLFTKPYQPKLVKYLNLALIALLLIGLGLWSFWHRKKLKKQVYN